MPRTTKPPAYRLYRRTGQAVVTLNGRDYYLGKYRTDASRAEYDRLIAEWLSSGRCLPNAMLEHQLTVLELTAAFWNHVQIHYVKDGRPTSEVHCYRQALRPVKRLFGRTPAVSFGPIRLKACRDAMIEAELCRTVVNRNVGRIRRMFRWASENELIDASVYTRLMTVTGLRRGRTAIRETDPVKPVAETHIDAVRPHVSRQVWAIVELQRLTGMRSGEVVIMRGRDLDMTGTVWMYRPGSHKTEHHGHERAIEIGPRAQKVIRPFLKPDLEAFLFSPVDAEIERRAELHAKRQIPLKYGNRPGTNRKRKPKRTPKDRYTADSLCRAIARACDVADRKAKEHKDLPLDGERIVPRWHPHQLRHNYGTRIRKEFGVEAARILLGHRSTAVTELYAEVDRGRVRDIVARVG